MALVNVQIKGRIFPHELSGPYIFKSGKKEGESVESLMFSNRSYLVYLKNIQEKEMGPVSNPNRLQLHLAWILNAGEFVRTTEVCPYCSDERRNIELFSVRYSGGECSYGHRYVSCDEPGCKYKLLEEKSSLMALKFSSLSYFRNTEQKRVGTFFKEVFLGTGRLDPERAFELFLGANLASQH